MTEEMTEQEKQEQIIIKIFLKVKDLESRVLQLEAWKNEYFLPHYRAEDHTKRNIAIVIIIVIMFIVIILSKVKT